MLVINNCISIITQYSDGVTKICVISAASSDRVIPFKRTP